GDRPRVPGEGAPRAALPGSRASRMRAATRVAEPCWRTPRPPSDRRRYSGRVDAEHRVATRDAPQVVVGGARRQTLEEAADLQGPALEVGAQDGRLVCVAHLDGAEWLAPPTEAQLPAAGGAQVADPVRLPARRHQIAHPVAHEQVHRHDTPFTRFPS